MPEHQPTPRNVPTGLMRWLFKAPIYLYRWHLGWLLGGRFLLLHHIGRKSGLPREAVVEVVRHDPADDTFIIVSGFGEQAQWYQNLLCQPDITIQSGQRTLAVHAERLSLDRATDEMVRYGQAHPQAARIIGRYLGLEWDGSPSQAANVATCLPIIALRPR